MTTSPQLPEDDPDVPSNPELAELLAIREKLSAVLIASLTEDELSALYLETQELFDQIERERPPGESP